MKHSDILRGFHFTVLILLGLDPKCCNGASSNSIPKGSYTYIGGKSKDLAFSSPSLPPAPPASSVPQGLNGAASSLAAGTSYYEPRGDYGGGGYGGGGGGLGGGGWGSGGSGGSGGVYHYSIHQPHQQPYYHPQPMYYDDGGMDGAEKGLIGLLGLTGLKGLLGLLGLLKLLLPLLGLLLPLFLPLLLLKALALLALLLLIPVPVISTGTAGRKLPTTFEEGKAYLQDTVTELLSKIPSDLNQIVNKIKDSSASTELLKKKEAKSGSKQISQVVSSKSSSDKEKTK